MQGDTGDADTAGADHAGARAVDRRSGHRVNGPCALVLGSSSRYRRALLERLQLPFTVESPDIDESARDGESPLALVRRLAEAKARAVAARVGGALVIGSDQVAVLDGRIIGKPGNHERTVGQLRDASGRRVEFLTALCLYNSQRDRAQVDVVPYTVFFRALGDEEIEAYVRRVEPFDCAGGIRAEGLGISLFERMDGEDPTALVGLPLIRLCEMLRVEGVDPLR